MAVNFIKMTRGPQAAYDKLKRLGTLDENTLYFVYSAESDATGSLYLGSRLISGGDVQVQTSSLADMSDVSVDGVSAGDILVYEDGMWKNKSLEELDIAALEGDGASVTVDDVVKLFNFGEKYYAMGEEDWEEQEGFKAGLELRVREKLVGEYEIGWYEPVATLEELNDRLEAAEEQLEDTYTKSEVDDAISEAIGKINTLTYKVVDDLESIDTEADDADQYIYLVPKDDESGEYEEYLVVDGKVEHIGSFTANLDDYVQKEGDKVLSDNNYDNDSKAAVDQLVEVLEGLEEDPDGPQDLQELFDSKVDKDELETALGDYVETKVYKAEVGNLEDLVKYTSAGTIVAEINAINERLVWGELTEE